MDLTAYIIPDTNLSDSSAPMGSKNGFISSDGYRNATVQIGDYILRERSEILLLKGDKILLQKIKKKRSLGDKRL